jgi:lactoylglutathione lyase
MTTPFRPQRGARITHVALWVRDLERMRDFYVGRLGGTSGPLYHNERTAFRSCFVSFAVGPCLELMSDGTRSRTQPPAVAAGYAHLALAIGSREDVDACVGALAAAGIVVASPPRTTGDGYYEAVILDPEGNRIEITAG